MQPAGGAQPSAGPFRRRPMPRHSAALTAVLLLLAVPSYAVKEWYDYYQDALDQVKRGRCQEALPNLQEAVRLRPTSGAGQRTYGMDFIDYFPYYRQGLCYARTGDHNSAILMFDKEEKQGAIRNNARVYADLVRLRELAQTKAAEERAAVDRQAQVKRASEDAERWRREGAELHQSGRSEEALARLAQAEKAAELLDPAVQQQIADLVKRIRADLKDRSEQAARNARIEQGLANGRRLLDAGHAAEAQVLFAEVLGLDPQNAVAKDGRREAQAHILAETTQQDRDAALRQGKALLEAGQYEQALRPLTEAAADPRNLEAAALVKRVQDRLERMRHQKDVRVRIDALLADGERLIDDHQFSEAEVKLRSALELDPGNTLVAERLQHARRMTKDQMRDETFPNRAPAVSLFDKPTEVEGGTLALRGYVTDDRGLARVQYRLGNRLVWEQVFTEGPDGEYPLNFRIDRVFDLEAGPNDLSVIATDVKGLTAVESFAVRRRLRFYETRAFLPSAAAAAIALLGLVWLAQRARRRRALRSRFNPYIAGAPVMSDQLFFGRRKLLARILNVLHHNSLLITGERRIGKTTLLYHLRLALQADDQTGYRFFPVQTDLQGVPEEAFFHTIMSDITEQLGLRPETTGALRFRREEIRYDGRDFSHDLQRVVDELKTRTPLHVKLAMLVDEVDVLNEYSERVNQRLRSIFMKTFSEHLVAIMSGVGIKRLWTSEGSPWYNFFDEVELTAFTREEAEALIREPVEGVFRYETAAVESILEASGLKPYLTQKFCIHAVNRMIEAGRTTVTAADVEAVREEVLREGRDEPAVAAPLAHASA
jgi:tetratricopeptide (TPR) repeat protein